MKPHRLIIAGTRTYSPSMAEIGSAVVEWLDSEATGDLVQDAPMVAAILSGTAKGADEAGEQWAALRSIPVERFPADWSGYGKAAGKMRNIAMAKRADGLIAFWDGMSPGTAHMIAIATARGLHVVVRRTFNEGGPMG